MKKLIIAAIAFTAVSYASAQTSEKTTEATKTVVTDNQDKRTPVKLEELPETVKKSLTADTYAGWTPTAAFWVEGKASSYYEVELSKGDDKTLVKFDKQGQLVK